MDRERVAPELRERLRYASVGAIDKPWRRGLARAVLRLMRSSRVEGVTLERSAGSGLGARIHRPQGISVSGTVLWIHGGGLVIGRAAQNDRLCGELAREAAVAVISVEYRKAPEHPFPVALEDCHAGWAWLQREAAALGLDPDRVIVAGESAGAGLAAALVQRLHDEGGPQPLGQLLFCPMLDDRTAARRELDEIDHPVWDNRLNRFGWRSYLGVEPGAETVPPHAVPARRSDLAGLPPAWIGVGELELFHDEDVAYADRLRAAGVPVELDVVPGAVHGFEVWAPDSALARAHVGRAHRWLRRLLGESGDT
jgi:acetyl esterase/lipase